MQGLKNPCEAWGGLYGPASVGLLVFGEVFHSRGGRSVLPGAGRPGVVFFIFFSLLSLYVGWLFTEKPASRREANETKKTLSGGSLGSCVDEERSQLRELM